ncbi:phosphotransferase family protein [Saliphagus infecundisoli]|uniref:Phosphotransferase family protein n=1 Tax=Saliphagus infecundisoli TaxID=1849069 RepID=A0ABD5QBG2_9EURY|nr:phosphotransferase [Saliphagus infecundisoli]
MKREPETTIAQYANDARVLEELHAVPPYRVYEVSLDGRRGVLKIDDHSRGHAADEGRVHAFVASETSMEVPNVIAVGDDHYVTDWEDAFEGSPTPIEEEWAHIAGVWLGGLHADTADAFPGFGRPRDHGTGLTIDVHDRWTDAARERIAYHREFLETVGHADVADAVDRFLGENPGVFEGCGGPVLCHGDVHPEHLSRTDGGTATAIDFEHALGAPAEYDYWRAATPYFEAADGVGTSALRAFQAGYESVRELPAGIEERRPAFRLLNLVAFLESLYLQENLGADERERRAENMRRLIVETVEDAGG